MALAGRAFLALWNDIAPEREIDYDRWHALEHVPERVAVDGFHGARRYVNRARATHRYFTLYDIASPQVLEGAEYRDLVDHPTPASASMRADFANVVRVVCSVTFSGGAGIGGAIACLCVPAAIAEMRLRVALEAALASPRVGAAHLGATIANAPAGAIGAAPPRAFDRVALVEAMDREAASGALMRMQRASDLDALPGDFGAEVYDLAFVFPGADPAERDRYRRRGWGA